MSVLTCLDYPLSLLSFVPFFIFISLMIFILSGQKQAMCSAIPFSEIWKRRLNLFVIFVIIFLTTMILKDLRARHQFLGIQNGSVNFLTTHPITTGAQSNLLKTLRYEQWTLWSLVELVNGYEALLWGVFFILLAHYLSI